MDANTSATAEVEIVDPKPTQLAPREPPPKTPRALMLKQALQEETEQRALLREYVQHHMMRGEDYGEIPGTKRPSLLKPGAEKLFDLFRCRPEYEVMARDVNREEGLYSYEIKCKAVSRETDTVLNEGVGSASSYESKYRYRSSGRKCPSCGAEAIKRSKFAPRGRPNEEPGWYCYDKAGGCGANFAHDDATITEQTTGKVQNPDLADVANTVLKMAKKRAQVDCAIALARVSDMFTQDVEDMPGGGGGEEESPFHGEETPPQKPAPKAEAPKAAAVPPQHVAELWAEVKKAKGEAKSKDPARTRAAFAAGAKAVFGEKPKASNEWTPEETKQVREAILGPDDIRY